MVMKQIIRSYTPDPWMPTIRDNVNEDGTRVVVGSNRTSLSQRDGRKGRLNFVVGLCPRKNS